MYVIIFISFLAAAVRGISATLCKSHTGCHALPALLLEPRKCLETTFNSNLDATHSLCTRQVTKRFSNRASI